MEISSIPFSRCVRAKKHFFNGTEKAVDFSLIPMNHESPMLNFGQNDPFHFISNYWMKPLSIKSNRKEISNNWCTIDFRSIHFTTISNIEYIAQNNLIPNASIVSRKWEKVHIDSAGHVRITNRWIEQPPWNWKSKFTSSVFRFALALTSLLKTSKCSQPRIARLQKCCCPIFYPCRFSIHFQVLNLTSICFWQWVRG